VNKQWDIQWNSMKAQFEQKVHDKIYTRSAHKYVPIGLVTFVAHLIAGKHDIKTLRNMNHST